MKATVKPPNVESQLVPDVWYRPKVVIETIASEITLSPSYPAGMDAVRKGSGLALRFPKFTGKIRDEKGPEDATTVKEIVEIYGMQLKKIKSNSARWARLQEEGRRMQKVEIRHSLGLILE